MKKSVLLILALLLVVFPGFSQKKSYTTAAWETIFSFADIKDKGNSENSILRFVPAFNLQAYYHRDFSRSAGVFIGLAFRNIGYIYDNYKTPTTPPINYKKKFRSYNLGVPAGFKLGNLDRTFFYAGYEVEVPVLYKEKTFDGGDKTDKITGWFSDRQELFQHGPLAGVQFPYGINVKFKYYLSEFHNQDFTESSGNKPYAELETHIYYISLSVFLFRNFKYDSEKPGKK